jgi:hypothetical protein
MNKECSINNMNIKVHNKKENHNCPECESVFHQATELMAHIHACHPEKKNLECKVGDK